MPYDPDNYWAEQHRRTDLSSVGHAGYSGEWNGWLYRAWLETGRSFLDRHGVRAETVCDVGAGKGSWFPVWRAIGAQHITSIDFAADAPSDRAIRANLGEPLDIGTFDLVAAIYVLLHITDDKRFGVALDNLARMVKPSGWLILAEPVLLRAGERPYRGESSRSRALERYRFDGLELVAIEPATVIAGDGIEGAGWSRYPARAPFALLSRLGSRLPWLFGPMVAQVDPWLARRGCTPSSKLLLWRRPEIPSESTPLSGSCSP